MSGFPTKIVEPARVDGSDPGSLAVALCAAACDDFLTALDEALVGLGVDGSGSCACDLEPDIAARIAAVARMKAAFESSRPLG
ncbi:hypothetical protein QYS60_24890 [Rhodococcus sp. GXMU-t2271]|uniref:Uncharacterized protein n=1 Tax=Rhodococcus indonesiensis TaxID=3055869 RepID=A0ABT7RML0_9NOCA|nr:hypothetical protein [Rhodococcus indonesiensis]MDM7488862.1 hypothetical protein [Rhodococcus indonesiensis]